MRVVDAWNANVNDLQKQYDNVVIMRSEGTHKSVVVCFDNKEIDTKQNRTYNSL